MSEETTLINILFMICVNIVITIVGFIIWYNLWVKKYGGNLNINITLVYIQQTENNQIETNFYSKNFSLVSKEIFKKFYDFEKEYLLSSIGMEGYVYLTFQRRVTRYFIILSFFSLGLSLISILIVQKEIKESKTYSYLENLLLSNKYLNDFTTIIQLFNLFVFSFLHFFSIYLFRKEVKQLYFERFNKMSNKKDYEWLTCRTLHVSGIAPTERNSIFIDELSKYVKKKIRSVLAEMWRRKERNRAEINYFKNVIRRDERSFVRRYLYPRVLQTNGHIEEAIKSIDSSLEKEVEMPVFSGGHAFVCFDSILSTYLCLIAFHEDTFKKVKMQINSFFDSNKVTNIEMQAQSRVDSTFGKFEDEDLELEIMDHENVDMLVDQMIEPLDIIWLNIGGGRGLFICRRILLSLSTFFILIFLSTPAAFLSGMQSIRIFSFLDLSWIYDSKIGKLILSYSRPLFVIILNQLLIIAIDITSYFEKHYTHSRCQNSILDKAFFYLFLNMLIIPGFTLATADKSHKFTEIFANIYISDSGFFFIQLIIQNGTLSSVFYLIRMGEIISNKFSTFIAYHKRFFMNSGKHWIREEKDIFQYGFFYAQMMVIYSIVLVFSSMIPFISISGVYFFLAKHFVDFLNILTVHKIEMDSSGELVNTIIKYSNIPILLFQLCMSSYFFMHEKYFAAIIGAIVILLSLFYMIAVRSKYIFDIFSLNETIQNYEHTNERISINEISKWRNKFKHPLVIPTVLEDQIPSHRSSNN